MTSEGLRRVVLPINPRRQSKVRTGCRSCKVRKLKCDENKPVCTHCAKYYDNPPPCQYIQSQSLASRARLPVRNACVKILPRPAHPQQEASRPTELMCRGSSLDPFSTQQPSRIPDVQQLLQHYFIHFEDKALPIVMQVGGPPLPKVWWTLISEDRLLFHSTLQLSALDLDRRHGVHNFKQHRIQLGIECVSLLRHRIAEEFDGVSDTTIVATLNLLIVEHERENLRAVNAHMDGIKRMVKLRGGLSAIRSESPVIANIIYGTTTIITAESQFPTEPGQVDALLSGLDIRCPEPMITNFEELGIAVSFASLFRRLQYSIWKTETTRSYSPESSDTSQLAQCLLDQPLPDEDKESTLGERSLTDAFRWTSIFVVFLPFVRDYPNPRVWVSTICHKLRTALVEVIKVVPMNHPLMQSMFATGAIVAQLNERKWFLNHLIMVVEESNVKTWPHFKRNMTRLLWYDPVAEPPCRKLWAEVRTAITAS